MTYEDSLAYITEALKFGINPGLEKIEKICEILGNPQLRYPTVHITGTNGKTSTTWMTARLLNAAGLKVACYTSPHLHSYRERIMINGEMITRDDFASTLSEIKPAIEKVKSDMGDLTEFEILTTIAIQYFSNSQVDVAVFEVGLGGRWDATSVINPKVAVITGVSLDHTDRLGNTIEDIAWDKSHIIKQGSMAILGQLSENALKIIYERCKTVGAQIKLFGRDFKPKNIEIVKNMGSIFDYNGIYSNFEGIELPVFGSYQVSNFSIALAVCEAFLERKIDLNIIKKGLDGLVCKGRFELISNRPLVVLDGAHNPEGMKMLINGLPEAFKYDKLHVVLAISSDKDIKQMLEILGRKAATVVLSQNASYRSASVQHLEDIALTTGNSYSIEPDLEKAIKLAISNSSKSDLICITGSLYTVADARAMFKNNIFEHAIID